MQQIKKTTLQQQQVLRISEKPYQTWPGILICSTSFSTEPRVLSVFGSDDLGLEVCSC